MKSVVDKLSLLRLELSLAHTSSTQTQKKDCKPTVTPELDVKPSKAGKNRRHMHPLHPDIKPSSINEALHEVPWRPEAPKGRIRVVGIRDRGPQLKDPQGWMHAPSYLRPPRSQHLHQKNEPITQHPHLTTPKAKLPSQASPQKREQHEKLLLSFSPPLPRLPRPRA